MTEVLFKNGLNQSKEDPCLFYVKEEWNFLYCEIYADDMITISNVNEFEEKYMKKIEKDIDIKDLGEAKVFLGMQVEQDNESIYVHQRDYTEKLLKKHIKNRRV